MNKYQKILTILALITFSLITAEAKIGDTQDQVIRFAQKHEDIAQVRSHWYGGNPAIDVVYTDGTTLTHVFGASGREIEQYLYAPKRLTDAQVKEVQRIYHTNWRGMGTEGGVYSWQSASNLYMAAIRYETYDFLLIWDCNHMGEINIANSNALRRVNPPPAPSTTEYPPQQQSYVAPAPVPQGTPNDCLIVATEAYARLKSASYWVRIAGFNYTGGEPGHAVVLFQPTEGSNVWLYDAAGSKELATRSHELKDIGPAINGYLKAGDGVSNLRWVER
jgi:hypothetical protein